MAEVSAVAGDQDVSKPDLKQPRPSDTSMNCANSPLFCDNEKPTSDRDLGPTDNEMINHARSKKATSMSCAHGPLFDDTYKPTSDEDLGPTDKEMINQASRMGLTSIEKYKMKTGKLRKLIEI